jgi:isoleucyl-tRNA synthetase
MPELERYVLALLGQLDATLKQAIADLDFNTYVRALSDFANEDLSAFFFDIRKDCLYCDAPGDPKRRAYRSVLDTLFHALVRYAAPVLVFTSEEVWGTRYPDAGSVHLLEWPDIPMLPTADIGSRDSEGLNDIERKWQRVRDARTKVTEAIEPLRRDKVVRSSLEAEVLLGRGFIAPGDHTDNELAEIFISGTVRQDITANGIVVTPSDDHKCGRCWRLLPEVPEDGALCARCEEVVNAMDAIA